jgi:hypothetical protein
MYILCTYSSRTLIHTYITYQCSWSVTALVLSLLLAALIVMLRKMLCQSDTLVVALPEIIVGGATFVSSVPLFTTTAPY